jgi:hypothetical protein
VSRPSAGYRRQPAASIFAFIANDFTDNVAIDSDLRVVHAHARTAVMSV